MKNKINIPLFALCGALGLGLFNCTSPPAPRHDTLEWKLDLERESQTYVLEMKKDNLFVGITPIKSADDRAGYIMGIYDKKGKDESINMTFEIYANSFEIFDEFIKKSRMSTTNCYSGQITIQTPEFNMVWNKKYEVIGNKKTYSQWTHVYGDVCGKNLTIIDFDGDGNPERIYYDEDSCIKLYPDKKDARTLKSLEKNKDFIIGGLRLFENAKKYFSENVGNFEEIKF
jgi:hypothetical protein